MNSTASINGRRTCREAHSSGPTVHDSGTERLLRSERNPGPSRPNLPRRTAGRRAAEFLRLGADVEIIEPAELRTRISAVARGLAAIYPAHQPGQASS